MRHFLFFAVIILCINGCKKADAPVRPDYSKVIWPLSLHSYWEYNDTGYHDTITYVDTTTMKVDNVREENQRVYYKLNRYYTEYTLGDKGLNEYSQGGPAEGTLYLKYPAMVNDYYLYGEMLVTVKSIDTTVTVPAGTFNCYYYHFFRSMDNVSWEMFLAPGVGPVKEEYYTNGRLNERRLLRKYYLE